MPPQHHHSPIETAARLTFRRAPSFSSPVGPLISTASGGKRGANSGGNSNDNSSTLTATLRGLFSGRTSAEAAAGGGGAATHRSRSNRRPGHVRFGGEEEEEEDDDGRGRGDDDDVDGLVPLKMTLGRFNGGAGGRTRMVFTDEGWQIDDDLRRAYERRIHELTEELAETEHAAMASHSKCKRLQDEKEDQGVLKFKNRLLVEMLAIAQLDEAAAREALGRERAKSEEYRKELERCYARMLGFGIDPLSIPSEKPAKSSGGLQSPTKRRA